MMCCGDKEEVEWGSHCSVSDITVMICDPPEHLLGTVPAFSAPFHLVPSINSSRTWVLRNSHLQGRKLRQGEDKLCAQGYRG